MTIPAAPRANVRAVAMIALGITIAAAAGCSQSAADVPKLSVPRLGPASYFASNSAVPSDAVSSDSVPGALEVRQQEPRVVQDLDVTRVLAHSRAIERFGRRPEGGDEEHAAADYVIAKLRAMGYEVEVEPFTLPNGRTSRNVIARSKGRDRRAIVVSAHTDTKTSTPGANDDAAGCGILLEMARILAKEPAVATVEFAFFGAEEFSESTPRDHHFGSRYHVARMTADELRGIAGMISVDVVGYGSQFVVRTMRIGPRTMSDLLLDEARRLHVGLSYLRDPGQTGWSDHEPYEKAGVPAAWLERLQDPQYHQPGDTTSHLQPDRLRESGQFVLDVVRRLDSVALDRLSR